MTNVVYQADNITLCADCADMRYQPPSCTGCGQPALSGWPAVGRPHKNCPNLGRFQALDDQCELIVARRRHPAVTCDLCDAEVPPIPEEGTL